MNKRVGVVVVTFNNICNTVFAVESLFNSDYEDIDVLIIDNGSDALYKNKLYETVIKRFPRAGYSYLEKALGYGGACNEGARYCMEKGADVLMFLNNDVILDKQCVSRLVGALENENTVIAGPKIYSGFSNIIQSVGGSLDRAFFTIRPRGNGEADKGQYSKPDKVDFISGCAFMILTDCFAKLGMFDEKFYYYCEETDLCYRALKAGHSLAYEPGAVAYHWPSTTMGSESKKTMYYMARNQLYFAAKHTSNSPIKILCVLLYVVYYYIFRFGLIKVAMVFTKCIATAKGVGDFMAGRSGRGPYG